MIRYSYTIKRDERDETVVFKPKGIPTELPSLVYIEGPNSSGKSTLLNLMALAFNGQNRKDMNESLKNKINSLIDKSYQNTEFQIELDDNDKKLRFCKDLNSEDIIRKEIVNEKEKSLSKDLIDERYNLIYDIPENPIGRLKELNMTIKYSQLQMNTKISRLRERFHKTLAEVKESRDPDKLKELEGNIKSRKEQLNGIIDEERSLTNALNFICRYIYIKNYRNYEQKIKEYEKKIEDEEKIQKAQSRKVNLGLKRIQNIIYGYREDLNGNYDRLTPIIKSIFQGDMIVQLWESIDFNQIFLNYIVPNNIKNTIDALYKKFDKKEKSLSKNDINNVGMWTELIKVLEKYEKDDLQLPGISKSISEYIKLLKVEKEKKDQVFQDIRKITNAKEYIEDIKRMFGYLENKLLDEYKKSLDQNGDYNGAPRGTSSNIQSKLKAAKEQKSRFGKLCVEVGINLDDNESISQAFEDIKKLSDNDNIRVLNQEKGLEKINELKTKQSNMKSKIDSFKKLIEKNENDYSDMLKRKPHELHGKEVEISEAIMKLQEMSSKLAQYDQYIEDILRNKFEKEENNPEKMKYFDQVSVYLGRQIKMISHIDKKYEVLKVNFVDNLIETKEGKIIRFDDMGTGQSQAAYLLGKLNSLDDRKVIALFDEVAMMDQNSLKPIFEKLISLHEQGKLIASIVVQKSESIAVKPLEGI